MRNNKKSEAVMVVTEEDIKTNLEQEIKETGILEVIKEILITKEDQLKYPKVIKDGTNR